MVVIKNRRRHRPFTETKLYPDLTLRTTRGAGQLKSSKPGRVIRVGQVLQRYAEGADEGFGSIAGLGVEDLEGEMRLLWREKKR